MPWMNGAISGMCGAGLRLVIVSMLNPAVVIAAAVSRFGWQLLAQVRHPAAFNGSDAPVVTCGELTQTA
jgi:hypothetical protein